jgi:hypothetical protein
MPKPIHDGLTASQRYRLRHPEKCRAASLAWQAKNPNWQKDWNAKNPEKVKASMAKSRAANPEMFRKATRQWRAKNKAHRAEYARTRRRENPEVRLLDNLRSRLSCLLRENGNYKAAPTLELLGCSLAALRVHLAGQFALGMTWENYGRWHVDHRIPCSSFDLSDFGQQAICFHFSNLQPMWGADNSSKGGMRGSRKKPHVALDQVI